jgi:hypothetical protein
VLLECGLVKSAVAYKREDINNAVDKQIEAAYNFLMAFQEVRVGAYRRAKAEVSDEQWARYKAMAVKGLWEQENLEAKRKDLVADWRNRPNLLRKIKDKKLDQHKPKIRKKKK